MKTITFSEPTAEDHASFNNAGLNAVLCLAGRKKIDIYDEQGNHAELFIPEEVIDRLGKQYIVVHMQMEYSSTFEQWIASFSENDYYNDLNRNPEKVIAVEFVEMENGTGREVYRGIESRQYFLREVSSRENFAKWYVCGVRRCQEDGNEPRANLIFEYNGQREKVVYDDWNGVAAYQETFNPNFKPE